MITDYSEAEIVRECSGDIKLLLESKGNRAMELTEIASRDPDIVGGQYFASQELVCLHRV